MENVKTVRLVSTALAIHRVVCNALLVMSVEYRALHRYVMKVFMLAWETALVLLVQLARTA